MRVTAAQCQSAEGVPLSDTCQTPHTPSGGANELQLSGASPVSVRCRCAFVGHLSINSHPLWRCQRAPAERGKPSASPLKVCLCRTPVTHLTPPLEVTRSSSGAAQAQCKSAEGVPLSDTCQTPHTPSGGANELQLSRASPVNSPLKVCLCRTHVNHLTPPVEVPT